MKILMVCLGNICRSPLAEGILQHKAKEHKLNWEIDSAATLDDMVGSKPDKSSIKVALKHGIDINNQRARLFIKEDLEKFDLIYAMASDVLEGIKYVTGQDFNPEKVKLFLDEEFPGMNRDVPDPYMMEFSAFEEVYKMIDEGCNFIINKYKPVKQNG